MGMSTAELVESSVAVQFYSEGSPDIKNALYNADSIYTLRGCHLKMDTLYFIRV